MNEQELIKCFCKNLLMLRNDKKATQKDIAEKLDVCISTYANWEQGRREPSIWYLAKLVDIFEIDMNTLFDFLDND